MSIEFEMAALARHENAVILDVQILPVKAIN